MLDNQTISFIGGGNMAEAILKGVIDHQLVPADRIQVTDIRQDRLAWLEHTYGITPVPNNETAAESSDILVLAIKPQQFSAVAQTLNPHLNRSGLVVSILAGTTINTIRTELGHDAIVRTMPNTPAMVGEGMTIWTKSDSVSDAQAAAADALLNAYGRAVFMADEKYIDMGTALSGSGPGYFFLIFEAMIDAGVQLGLTRAAARDLVLQTALGSAKLAQDSDNHLADLRNRVTSPGGTTAAGLHAMEQGTLRATLADGIIACYKRANELGQK